VRLAFSVPPGAFSPPPQVESAVMHLEPYREPPVPIADPSRFGAVVRAAFSPRRKSLANAVAAGLAISADRARRLAREAGIDPGRRAENLSLADFARLAAVPDGSAQG
jgi:16S rRNA (adenine1518-N6/adenine1519-N6)-dimethyltransferase